MQTEKREYLSDWARNDVAQGLAEGRAEGRAKGKIESILAVLEARGLDVPGGVRDEIAACRDLDRLEDWVRAAVTVDSANELLSRSTG